MCSSDLVNRIDGKTDKFRVEFLEIFGHGGEGHELGGADRGEIRRVGKENNPFSFVVFGEINLSHGRSCLKSGRFLSYEREPLLLKITEAEVIIIEIYVVMMHCLYLRPQMPFLDFISILLQIREYDLRIDGTQPQHSDGVSVVSVVRMKNFRRYKPSFFIEIRCGFVFRTDFQLNRQGTS